MITGDSKVDPIEALCVIWEELEDGESVLKALL